MNNKQRLYIPIEYYERLAGYGVWAWVDGHGQLLQRLEVEARTQAWEHITAKWQLQRDIEARRNPIGNR